MRLTRKRKRKILLVLSEYMAFFGENAQAAESAEDRDFWWEQHTQLKQERKRVRRAGILQEPAFLMAAGLA